MFLIVYDHRLPFFDECPLQQLGIRPQGSGGVERAGGQHLDRTEDIEVHLLTAEEAFALLSGDKIRQSLMAAPLWKHFYEKRAGVR